MDITIRELEANGMTFRCRTAGDSGEPVILLHGFPETSHMWTDLMPRLADNGYRTLAPDLRGYSPGARPDDVSAYSYEALASDVFALADASAFDRFHLVGHDWGAIIGWAALRIDGGTRIASWTSLSIPHYLGTAKATYDDPGGDLYRGILIQLTTEGVFEGLVASQPDAFRSTWSHSSPEEIDEYLGVLQQPGAMRAAASYYRACNAHKRALEDPSAREMIGAEQYAQFRESLDVIGGAGTLFETNATNDAEANNLSIVQVASAVQVYADLRATNLTVPSTGVGGAPITLKATPALQEVKDGFGNVNRIGILGITRSNAPDDSNVQPVGPLKAVALGAQETWFVVERTLWYIGRVFIGRESTDQLGGPIRIAEVSCQVATAGLAALIHLTAILSVSIGLLNLFPIPLLDGGHLLFYGIEAARGRPLSERAQELGFRIGFAVVVMLMIFTTYNDILRLLPASWRAFGS